VSGRSATGRITRRAAGLLPPRPVVVAYAVALLLVLASAFAAESLAVRNPALTSGSDLPILRSLTSWDGYWYLGVARDGYHAAAGPNGYHDYAFLPLYPLLVRVLSLPWPGLTSLVGVVVSAVALLGALGVFVRLGRRVVDDRRAILGAALLPLCPFAAPLFMAYPESLGLLLAVVAFEEAEQDRRATAGLVIALGALARPQGAVLALPVFLVWYLRDGRRFRASQAWVLLGPLAFLGFVGYVGALTGDPLGYLHAQATWGRGGLGGVGSDVTFGDVLSSGSPIAWVLLLQLATFGVGIFLLVFARPDRLRMPYAVVPVVTLVTDFATGNLASIGRHLTLAFPYAWILAGRRPRIARCLLVAGLPVALAVLSSLTFAGRFVP